VAKYKIGDSVKIVKIMDDFTSKDLMGKVGRIEDIEELPNGHTNYWVDGHYMHEEELSQAQK